MVLPYLKGFSLHSCVVECEYIWYLQILRDYFLSLWFIHSYIYQGLLPKYKNLYTVVFYFIKLNIKEL
jgi:hypothetical protein